MNKKNPSESDICDKFIRPAMEKSGWNGMDQPYREFPLRAGRMVVRGQKVYRDKTTVLRADSALFYKLNIPLAVVEVNRVNELRVLCTDLRERLKTKQSVQSRLADALVSN
jgi:type I site-specific restriction endonuclease